MNILYAKTAIYTFVHAKKILDNIDEMVENRALASMTDCEPCLVQAQRIIDCTVNKIAVLRLRAVMKKIFLRLDKDEIDCLDYKYLKMRNREYYKDFDYTSRNYFRKQTLLAKKIAFCLEKVGFDEEFFKKVLFCITPIKSIYRQVVEQELLMRKNKSKKNKITKLSA